MPVHTPMACAPPPTAACTSMGASPTWNRAPTPPANWRGSTQFRSGSGDTASVPCSKLGCHRRNCPFTGLPHNLLSLLHFSPPSHPAAAPPPSAPQCEQTRPGPASSPPRWRDCSSLQVSFGRFTNIRQCAVETTHPPVTRPQQSDPADMTAFEALAINPCRKKEREGRVGALACAEAAKVGGRLPYLREQVADAQRVHLGCGGQAMWMGGWVWCLVGDA